MHQVFRGAARIAAVVGLAVSGSALVAVPPAIADIGFDMGLVCSGKSGTHDVALRIETTVPSTGTVGQPIQLGTIKIDVDLPPELVKEVSAISPGGASTPPATSVTPSSAPSPALGGVAEIQVAVHGPSGDRRAGWPAFALTAAPPRGDGAVHLTGSGVAPPVVPEAPGGLSWSAGAVDLSLVPGDTTTGKDAAGLALHCAAEKAPVLGSVRVQRGDEGTVPGASSAAPRQATASQEGLCKLIPGRGEDPRYAINYEDPKLREIFDSPKNPDGLNPGTDAGLMYCIKATGYFNIKKVGNAAPVAFENNVRVLTESYLGDLLFGPNWTDFRGYFINRTYPTPATMLGFGFMPTRAVAEAVQVGSPKTGANGPITGNLRILQKLSTEIDIPDPAVDRQQLKASAYVRVKAGKAEVNGVPLDLGDKCMTSPTSLSATGFMGTLETGTTQYDSGQSLIAENVTIPSFSGCGVTEDLSPILTASVSGSGNYANLESGIWCQVTTGNRCVDGAGALPQTFTVDPGGVVTAVAKPFTLGYVGDNAEFRCESATMRLDLERGHWQSRFRLGKGDMSLDGCEVEGSDGTVYQVKNKVTQDGSLWLNMTIDPTTGQSAMQINGVLLNAAVDVGGGEPCTLRISDNLSGIIFPGPREVPGYIGGSYGNGTLSGNVYNLKPSVNSTCSIPGFTDPLNGFNSFKGDFVFRPAQRITSP
ncbi:hypothetical protein [Actinomadura chokoriensis]|uniref:DUF6801 domain-containing protein n=1 Tax=Actinomadura chokoriensis TaxID=454156 RepID=A0ABV4R501_9ACTN